MGHWSGGRADSTDWVEQPSSKVPERASCGIVYRDQAVVSSPPSRVPTVGMAGGVSARPHAILQCPAPLAGHAGCGFPALCPGSAEMHEVGIGVPSQRTGVGAFVHATASWGAAASGRCKPFANVHPALRAALMHAEFVGGSCLATALLACAHGWIDQRAVASVVHQKKRSGGGLVE